MLKKKFLTFILSFSFMSISSQASVDHVVPKELRKGSLYLHVSNPDAYTVSFKQCFWQIADSCQQIGEQESYRIDILEDQRFVEQLQVVGSGLGVASVGALTAGVGLLMSARGLSYAIFQNPGRLGGRFAELMGDIGPYVMKYVPFATMAAAPFVSDALNPREQYIQAATLRSAVLLGENVESRNIGRFISALKVVLAKIDGREIERE